MMGRTHAASGVLAGVVTANAAGAGPVDRVGWVAVVAGSALLPDLDMPRSTVGRLWGPLSGGIRVRFASRRLLLVPGFAHLVGAAAGGHRQGTHSFVGIASAAVLVWVAGLTSVTAAFAIAVTAGLVILAADFWVPGRMHWPANLAVCAGVGVAAYMQGWTLPVWLPAAVAAGMLVHCLGDEITRERVPWGWPFRPRTAVKPCWWRFHTGSRGEHVLLQVIGAGIAVAVCYRAGLDPAGALVDALSAG